MASSWLDDFMAHGGSVPGFNRGTGAGDVIPFSDRDAGQGGDVQVGDGNVGTSTPGASGSWGSVGSMPIAGTPAPAAGGGSSSFAQQSGTAPSARPSTPPNSMLANLGPLLALMTQSGSQGRGFNPAGSAGTATPAPAPVPFAAPPTASQPMAPAAQPVADGGGGASDGGGGAGAGAGGGGSTICLTYTLANARLTPQQKARAITYWTRHRNDLLTNFSGGGDKYLAYQRVAQQIIDRLAWSPRLERFLTTGLIAPTRRAWTKEHSEISRRRFGRVVTALAKLAGVTIPSWPSITRKP